MYVIGFGEAQLHPKIAIITVNCNGWKYANPVFLGRAIRMVIEMQHRFLKQIE